MRAFVEVNAAIKAVKLSLDLSVDAQLKLRIMRASVEDDTKKTSSKLV